MTLENSVTFRGNLTEDPVLQTVGNEAIPHCKITLAVSSYMGDGNNEVDGYFDINLWRDQAENAASTFKKGDMALVNGRFKSRTWTNQQGHEQTTFELEAEEIAPVIRFNAATVTRTYSR